MLTQETPRLPLLDYRKPPPGYVVRDEAWFKEHAGADHVAARAVAIAGEWAHFKRCSDPPGLGAWYGRFSNEINCPYGDLETPAGREVAIRAAAWRWHDRRLAVVLVLAEQLSGFWGPEESAELLAKALTWTDADCAEMDIFLTTPCPEDVNPYREGPACLMLAVWGEGWKPPAVNRFAPAAPPAPVVDQNQLELPVVKEPSC